MHGTRLGQSKHPDVVDVTQPRRALCPATTKNKRSSNTTTSRAHTIAHCGASTCITVIGKPEAKPKKKHKQLLRLISPKQLESPTEPPSWMSGVGSEEAASI